MLTSSPFGETPVPVCSSNAGSLSVARAQTVIAQTLPKNCVGESTRVIVKWYPALVTLLIGSRYVTH